MCVCLCVCVCVFVCVCVCVYVRVCVKAVLILRFSHQSAVSDCAFATLLFLFRHLPPFDRCRRGHSPLLATHPSAFERVALKVRLDSI